jgi:hypothetical protein
LAALGLALLGVVLLAQVLAGALGDLVVNALSALIA